MIKNGDHAPQADSNRYQKVKSHLGGMNKWTNIPTNHSPILILKKTRAQVHFVRTLEDSSWRWSSQPLRHIFPHLDEIFDIDRSTLKAILEIWNLIDLFPKIIPLPIWDCSLSSHIEGRLQSQIEAMKKTTQRTNPTPCATQVSPYAYDMTGPRLNYTNTREALERGHNTS